MRTSYLFSWVTILYLLTMFIPQISFGGENSLKKGKWALQFEIDRDFDLSGFQGQTLSMKRHSSDNIAYRVGVTLSLSVGDGESIRIDNDTLYRPRDRDINSRLLGINLQRVHYPDIEPPINLFFGYGLSATFQHSKNEDTRYFSNLATNHSKSVYDSWAIGVSGILGVEWFFTKRLSLLGEYSTLVNYGESKRKEDSWTANNGIILGSVHFEEKFNNVSISASRVRFGLSIYF